MMMKGLIALLAVVALCSTALALYTVSDKGEWPESWPKELEPLRKQSRTLVGPMVENRHYAIRFYKREEFESAWPHILKVKNSGAPIRLLRGENFFLGGDSKAGVVLHCPPAGGADNKATSVDLVVDGEIIDLTRIRLPPNTPIIDERFKDGKEK